MAITGNPGDLATGGFGTGISGRAATPGNVASAVSRGNSMAAGRQGGGPGPVGGLLGGATRAGGFAGATPASLVNAGLSIGRSINPMGAIYAGGGTGAGFTGITDSLAMQELQAGITADALRKSLLQQTGMGVPSPSLTFGDKIALSVGVNNAAAQGLLDTLAAPKTTELVQGTMTKAPVASTAPSLDTATRFASPGLASQLAAAKAAENIAAPVSPALTGEGWVDVAPGVDLSTPEAQDLLRMAKLASAQTGQRLTITSGKSPRAAGTLQHPSGLAVDVQAYSPTTGAPLSNYQAPENFAQYEAVAKAMRAAQMANYPQYNDTFRWGGYFSGTPDKYGALDLMHFDVNNPSGAGMLGGSWETGLTPAMRQSWNINSPTAPSIVARPTAVSTTPAAAPVVTPAPAPVAPTQVATNQTPFAYPSRPVTPTPSAVQQWAHNLLGTTNYGTGGVLGDGYHDSNAKEVAMAMLESGARKPVDSETPPEATDSGESWRRRKEKKDRAKDKKTSPAVPVVDIAEYVPQWYMDWYNKYGKTGGILA